MNNWAWFSFRYLWYIKLKVRYGEQRHEAFGVLKVVYTHIIAGLNPILEDDKRSDAVTDTNGILSSMLGYCITCLHINICVGRHTCLHSIYQLCGNVFTKTSILEWLLIYYINLQDIGVEQYYKIRSSLANISRHILS